MQKIFPINNNQMFGPNWIWDVHVGILTAKIIVTIKCVYTGIVKNDVKLYSRLPYEPGGQE